MIADAVARWTGIARDLLQRLIAMEIVDRSLVVGAQAFSALIPLLIVFASLGARDGSSLADSLIDRFDLSGSGADAIRRAMAGPASGSSVTIFSAIFVSVSALSFTRALQRTFERTWDLQRRGWRASAWGFGWLAAFVAYWALFPVVSDLFDGFVRWTVGLAGTFALWLMTPYLLLARRVPWRRLILQALLTALGMTIVVAGGAIYLPRAISSSADEFGALGVAFTLLSLLWAGGFALVVGATVGSYPYTRSQP